jgi:hypothetical protein
MQFIAHHHVTTEDVSRALRLARRPAEVLLNAAIVIVLGAILVQVLYAFFIYLTAATAAPTRLLELLLMRHGATNAVWAWLAILITLVLPVFLFYTVRTLIEAAWPAVRVRRLLKTSDISGPTTYTINDDGVRSARVGGTETFMPWATFDRVRSDAEVIALLHKAQLRFFLPLAAFGAQRDQVAAEIRSRVSGRADAG